MQMAGYAAKAEAGAQVSPWLALVTAMFVFIQSMLLFWVAGRDRS